MAILVFSFVLVSPPSPRGRNRLRFTASITEVTISYTLTHCRCPVAGTAECSTEAVLRQIPAPRDQTHDETERRDDVDDDEAEAATSGTCLRCFSVWDDHADVVIVNSFRRRGIVNVSNAGCQLLL